MRKLLIAAFFVLSAGAFAQSQDVTLVNQAYYSMRQFPAVSVQVAASELFQGTTTTSSELIYWAWDPTGTTANSSKLAAFDSVNGSEISRLLADGTTLFSLNEKRNAYIAHQYGTPSWDSSSSSSSANPATYNMDLLQHFDYLSAYRGSYSARLLQEIFGSSAANYSPWSDGTMTIVSEASPPFTDPVTDLTYTPNSETTYVTYETSGVVSRSIVFELEEENISGNLNWVVAAVYVNEKDSTNPVTPRVLELTLTPSILLTAPADSEFAFVPPVGAKILQSTSG